MADRLKTLLCFDYDVDVVSDGDSLFDAAQARMPDLIVCDVMMPGMSGVTATRRILTTCPEARIILVSVRDDAAIIAKGFASGALGYVVKADAGEELIEAAETVLCGNRFVSSSAQHAPTAGVPILRDNEPAPTVLGTEENMKHEAGIGRGATPTIAMKVAALVLFAGISAETLAESSNVLPVTVDNFVRAETDLFFGLSVKDGALGKFHHRREVMGIDDQFVVRGNRDTLYSVAVFDLDAGPVTITLPDANQRFMSLQIIDEDQYVPNVYYGAGSYTLTKEQIGTRYVGTAIRTLADPENPDDVKQAVALQDAVKVDQPGGPGKFEVPNWDQASQKKVRDALLILAETLPDTKGAFGAKGEVEPVRRLISAASAWGGNPERDALYLNVTPGRNDGATIYRLDVKDVPVDGFWSISVYNAEGYYSKNQYNAYTLNSITARKGEDGSVAVQFGGCDGEIANCLPTVPGWNYMVRLYRAHPEILNGQWTFPEARPVD